MTVEFTYNADGNLATLKAKNSHTGDQTTTYVYGTSTGGITPEVYRNDLLRAEIYPDSPGTGSICGVFRANCACPPRHSRRSMTRS